jgi:ParB/RepB/Spo0J family partition protein
MTISKSATRARQQPEPEVSAVVPRGSLRRLKPADIKPSATNPRRLFDRGPLEELRENIRQHGVLVPITVYEVKGQNKYAILDGERRYRCCVELEEEGLDVKIPANVVDPPDKIAGILYMFSIHNFREAWELMPTALSLKTVMKALGEEDSEHLSKLTGLSLPQIERCKKLLAFPEKFQNLSLDTDASTRIPSNFWIEAYPVLKLCEEVLPDLTKRLGRDGITQNLVEKYRAKGIKSVIHFRRIMEAFELNSEDETQMKVFAKRLREYISDTPLETRKAFDEFVMDNRRVQSAVKACEEFTTKLDRSKLEHALEKDELIVALRHVRDYVEDLLQKLAGSDPPSRESEAEDVEGK